MADEKINNEEENDKVHDPLAEYRSSRIVFSSLENQADIQLSFSLNLDPVNRLLNMRKLNEYAYKNISGKKLLFKNARIIFSNYEYIP
jgi:hypothetical protein